MRRSLKVANTYFIISKLSPLVGECNSLFEQTRIFTSSRLVLLLTGSGKVFKTCQCTRIFTVSQSSSL